ncbi:MAG: sigma-70 family RNA polymerase sigma factor [Acidobacteriota bacterium]|nr:sigma-70 family RNA polymerase sigma factor [Acidobacteriota bacterium]
MTTPSQHDVTQLLLAWSDGDREALDQLIPLIYDHLRQLARRYMRRERPGHTLQTTALVNEVYLRLIDQRQARFVNRAHFFAVSAQLMRRIVVDHARTQHRAKRGGVAERLSPDEAALLAPAQSAEVLALDEALQSLAEVDQRKARVIEMRYFGGLSVEETAAVLEVSENTVIRDWALAKAWLRREMETEKQR